MKVVEVSWNISNIYGLQDLFFALGNMNVLLEMVSFSNCDSEERLKGIVREMIDNGEVPEYDGFFNESKAKKARRRRKWEKERKETEEIDSMLLFFF